MTTPTPNTLLKPWWREDRPGCNPTIWGYVISDTRGFFRENEEICCVREELIDCGPYYICRTAGMTVLRLLKHDEIEQRPSQ